MKLQQAYRIGMMKQLLCLFFTEPENIEFIFTSQKYDTVIQ